MAERKPVHRRTFTRGLAAAAVATTLAAVAGCREDAQASGGQPEAITYLTSFAAFGNDAYAYVAKEKGYFSAAGFEVDVRTGAGTFDNLKLVTGGQAQFSSLDLTGALLAAGTGEAKNFTAVAAIQQRTMAAIISLEGNEITAPKDLEGKRIADLRGSVVRNLFPTYAKLAGIDASKVEWVDGTPATLLNSLASGQVKAIGQSVVGKPTVEALAGGRKAVLLPYSDYLQDLYGNALVTSTDYATGHPGRVRAFTAALLKGLEYAVAHPAESAEILRRYVPATNAKAAAGELQLMSAFVRSEASGAPLGALDRQRVARSIAILQGAGAIPAGLTPDQVVSFDLAPKA
jgi:NitT/TauT family transport system substrate-binding protein